MADLGEASLGGTAAGATLLQLCGLTTLQSSASASSSAAAVTQQKSTEDVSSSDLSRHWTLLHALVQHLKEVAQAADLMDQAQVEIVPRSIALPA